MLARCMQHSMQETAVNTFIYVFVNLSSDAGFAKLIRGAKSGAWKNTTVREGWLNTLVTIEVLCWFFVGECIGKRHYVGYDV